MRGGQGVRCAEYSDTNRKRGPGCISLLLLFLQCRSWVAEEAMRSVSRACAPRLQPRERTASPFCLFLGLSIDTALLPSVPGTPLKATLIPSRTLVQSFCPQLRFSSVTRLLPSLAFAQLSKVPTPSLLHKLCVPPLTLIYGNLSH